MHNQLHHNDLIQHPLPKINLQRKKNYRKKRKKKWGNEIYKKCDMHVFMMMTNNYKLSLSGGRLILEERLRTGSPSSCGSMSLGGKSMSMDS